MRISKREIFANILESFGITTQIKETNNFILSGKYKYYKDDNLIIKESIEVEYIGGKYEKVKKTVIFIIEKVMGTIRVINKDTKRVIINFKHKTEPLILI